MMSFSTSLMIVPCGWSRVQLRRSESMSDALKDDLRHWSRVNKALGYEAEAKLYDDSLAYIEQVEIELEELKVRHAAYTEMILGFMCSVGFPKFSVDASGNASGELL
jgi:aspartokinase-like uncharacterized kinase